MGQPICIFGTTSKDFKRKVFALRKDIHSHGYDTVSDQLYTIPHLTLSFHKDFEPEDIKKVEEVVSRALLRQGPFSLLIKDFIIMENNIAASFDNSFTKTLAQLVSKELEPMGFIVVETDHMRLIRSEIKEEFLETVREIVDKELPKEIEITGVAIAGNLLREEDVLWNTDFI